MTKSCAVCWNSICSGRGHEFPSLLLWGGVRGGVDLLHHNKIRGKPMPTDSPETEDSTRRWAHTNTPKAIYDKTKLLSREMRSNPTAAENHLWQRLRKEQVLGFKFRRQYTIDRFIVDCYCTDAWLVIE